MRSLLLGFALVSACGTPGASPHDMSVAGHERAAAAQDQIVANAPAWTPSSEVEKHRKMAADHRAASQALRDAEATACVNVSPDDRDISPFEHYADIVSVEPLYLGARERRLAGATITIRPVPGLTLEGLRRMINCHLARNASLGHDVPEMRRCPLVPNDVDVDVSASRKGFEVEVQSWDPDSARAVLRRANSLVGK